MKRQNRIKKIGLAGLVMTAALLSTTACRKNSFKPEPQEFIDEERGGTQLILGFSQIGAESEWRICNTKSIFESAEKEGIQIIYDNAQQKQENQLKAIRSFIVYRVDAIAFVPIVETGWDNVLREAKDANIPVIIVDRNIKTEDENLYTGYIGENTLEEGKKAARFLKEKFAGNKEQLNILEIRGTDNSSAARNRASGFREEISSDKRFSIVASECGDFLRSLGKEIAENIIKTNEGLEIDGKKVDIIFSHNDAMTLGIIEVLEKNKIDPGHDVTIISFDGEEEAIKKLKEGKINCIVECNPWLGPDLMKLVKTCTNHNTIPKATYVEETVFTEESDFDSIGPRGF